MKFNINQCREYKDQYNIYNLITKIDKNYKLYFDLYDKFFKIINIAKNYEICLKTASISTNLLKKLQLSRIENINKIISDIDKNNCDILLKNKEKLKECVKLKTKEVLNLSKKANSISKSDINKILGENA